MERSEIGDDRKIRLAAIQHTGEQEIDGLISSIAYQIRDSGARIGGAIQANVTRSRECRCDMEMEILTTGQVIPISQRLGREARGCRLNDLALEHVVELVDASLQDDLDILVLNKFGKQEAEGRGLRNTIAKAVDLGIPVLVGLNRHHVAAWRQFCDGEGQLLEADPTAIALWLGEVLPDWAVR